MSNRKKSIVHLVAAAVVLFLFIGFQIPLAKMLSNFVSPVGPFDQGNPLRIVIYAGSGISIFFLISSLEFYLAYVFRDSTVMCRYNRLFLRILQWAVILLFGDIVLQNFKGGNITFTSFVPSYQCIGGMIGILMCLLGDFFYQARKSQT